MKRITAGLIAAALVVICACGCAANAPADEKKDDGRLSVVSTIFPYYDFARAICGDKADVYMLLPPGSESHSYEPTAQDIIKIQNSDLFIYTGGENDTWVEDILSSMDKPVKTVRMMDIVEVVEEEHVEGMEEEHEHEESEEHTEDEEHGHEHEEGEKEYDEHIWTSPKNAILIANGVAKALEEASPENAALFEQNAQAYTAELTALDKDFEQFFAGVNQKLVIFGDRFPLRYFADAYGIEYYAAFPGCSTDTEPSAATIAFLMDKVKECGATTVFYIEFSNHLVADSIAEGTGTTTALFHSCHNVSKQDQAAGATYVSLMRNNLATLKEAMK